MNILVCIVVYGNKLHEIAKCLSSLEHAIGRVSKSIKITVKVGNALNDTNFVSELNRLCNKMNFQFSNFGYNTFHSKGINLLSQDIDSDWILVLNPDTVVSPDLFSSFTDIAKDTNKNVAAIECRQIPFDHPKVYNPLNRETEWFSGAAVFLRQEVFRAAGGFDEVLFPMYCNDVDLSIRIRLLGYKLNFYHEIKVVHNKSFNQNMQIESSDFEINDSMVASILLLRKYGLITKAEELMTKNTILKELVLNDARFNLIEEVKYGNSRDARTIKEFLLQPNFGNREF